MPVKKEETDSKKTLPSEVELKKDEENIGKSAESGKKADLEKSAEAESTVKEKTLEERKKELLAKAKKLKGKIEETKTKDLKEQIKEKKRADMLIPLDEYVKAGIYLGTRVVTPNMRPFVYRRRADGLAIFNTDLIDEKLKEGVAFLSKFAPEDTILVCKREAGWRAAKKFGELTGIRVFTKKYPAGVLTNKQLPDFFENELTIITDHWVDKNALNDTLRVRKKVLMICDTNNFSKGSDQIILGNNKSPKSIGLIFYILAREYCKARKIKADIPDLEWWTGEVEDKQEKKRSITAEPGAA
jgi:small subunit ribosomal protein S2